jgi:hypothetical protein
MTAGSNTYTITDANGCTTTASVSVTEPSALVGNISASSIICNGGVSTVTVSATGGTPSYGGTGTFTMTTGSNTYTVTDANGCTTTTSVSVTEPSALVGNVSASSIICNGGVSTVTVSATGGTPSYSGVGTYTMTAGSNTYTVTDANGCVTTTSVSVTEPAAIVSSQTINVCSGQTYSIGSNTYSTTGIYTDVLVSLINGCDSTVTTNLNVGNTINVGTSLSGFVITANNSTATSYQWIDCNNSNLPVSGQTSQTFTATANGNYAVVVTEGACSDTSACVNIIGMGIAENNNSNNVSIYPNPGNGIINIFSPEAIKTIVVTDMLGKEILLAEPQITSYQMDISSEKAGVYFVKVITHHSQITKRIVISR